MYDKKKKSSVYILNKSLLPTSEMDQNRQIVGFVRTALEVFKNGREDLEQTWMEAWASYIGSSEALDYARSVATQVIGNVNDDWRHKINVGKAFEITETIVAYLAAAVFPNRDWVTIEPTEPMVRGMARILSKYFANKLKDWKFKTQFISSIRQAVITGSTTFAMPWRDGRIQFETLDNFDVYYDPSSIDAEESPVIRRVIMTRSEIIKKINGGEYENITVDDVCKLETDFMSTHDENEQIKEFYGLDSSESFSFSDKVECFEFWGDIILDGIAFYNYYAVIIGEHLVVFKESPYECGRPIVYGSYIPAVRQPYGLSAYQAVLGMLHVLNSATNQRLDNVELATNVMYKRKQSSITPAEDIYSEPGKVFDVLEMDEIEQFVQNPNNLLINYQEVATVQSSIEQSTGTGPLVSTSQPRGGERVTAQEVSMVREAGSNRLSIIHSHLEDTLLIPVLEKVLSIMRQFVSYDEIVRISGLAKDSNDYYLIGSQELKDVTYNLKPRGADYIIEQREFIEKRTAFIQLALSVPQFAERINFEKILVDLLEHWGFEDPLSYLAVSEEGTASGEAPMTPMQELGGKGLENAAIQEMALNGGNEALRQIAGIELPEGVRLDELLSGTIAGAEQLGLNGTTDANLGQQ